MGDFIRKHFKVIPGTSLPDDLLNDPKPCTTQPASWEVFLQSLGDCSYSFHLFPNVTLMIVYWQGDEDFPSNCQILFDAAAASQLPTDACAIAGSMLTRKLLSFGLGYQLRIYLSSPTGRVGSSPSPGVQDLTIAHLQRDLSGATVQTIHTPQLQKKAESKIHAVTLRTMIVLSWHNTDLTVKGSGNQSPS